MFTVPMISVVRIHASARNDIIHNAFNYGLFTTGFVLHFRAEKIGASVITISGGNSKRQIMILQDFGPTVICFTPSYALHLTG
jgi:phenylacetate-CoA ligase